MRDCSSKILSRCSIPVRPNVGLTRRGQAGAKGPAVHGRPGTRNDATCAPPQGAGEAQQIDPSPLPAAQYFRGEQDGQRTMVRFDNFRIYARPLEPTDIPEPSTLALTALALLGLAGRT
jgi:hypothetical protein